MTTKQTEMTNKEVLEGNTAIAEFMGGKLKPKSKRHPDNPHNKPTWWFDDKVGHFELEYHSSWDWLMPVVEKIDELVIPASFINSDYPEHVFTTLSGKTFWICIGDNHKIFEAKEDVKIASAWKAITDFLKWYNEKEKIRRIGADEMKYGNRAWE